MAAEWQPHAIHILYISYTNGESYMKIYFENVDVADCQSFQPGEL